MSRSLCLVGGIHVVQVFLSLTLCPVIIWCILLLISSSLSVSMVCSFPSIVKLSNGLASREFE